MENINLIIPMAGGGTRFKKEGIEMPKPLIDLNGKPFFFWAAQSIVKFLKVEKLIFIVLREHVEKHEIDKKILEYYPEAQLKVIDKVLNGAVLTCLEGVELIDNDNPILFNGHHLTNNSPLILDLETLPKYLESKLFPVLSPIAI